MQENFYCEFEDGAATKLIIDYTDHISGEESPFDDLGQSAIDASEEALDLLLELHDQDAWEEEEQLLLVNQDGLGAIKEADDLIWAGPGSVKLLASTSSADMHFLIEVFDQSPSGESVRLTQGNVLASMSDIDEGRSWYVQKKQVRPFLTLNKRKIIEPGKIYVLECPLSPVLATIRQGHQLVVRISTQSSPEDCPIGYAG